MKVSTSRPSRYLCISELELKLARRGGSALRLGANPGWNLLGSRLDCFEEL